MSYRPNLLVDNWGNFVSVCLCCSERMCLRSKLQAEPGKVRVKLVSVCQSIP